MMVVLGLKAYFITWRTYGTWLPGDPRGWSQHGVFGRQPGHTGLNRYASNSLVNEPFTMDLRERKVVHDAIVKKASERGWKILALNCRSNHVHLVIVSKIDKKWTMGVLKSAATNALKRLHGVRSGTRKSYWARSGYARVIYRQINIDNVVRYTRYQDPK